MLNQQKPLPRRSALHTQDINVHSIFPTIQGEGPFGGRKAVFVRLYGCNLQCPWCDTDYTSTKESLSPAHITEVCIGHGTKLVVITGGEPFRQNISDLVHQLLRAEMDVQIETNGTLAPMGDFPWGEVTVVVSPKTSKLNPTVAKNATAYKYVLQAGQVAPDGLPMAALGHATDSSGQVARPPKGWYGDVFLQPMDAQDEDANWQNCQAVVRSVMLHSNHPEWNLRMGVQMHKLMGLP